MRGWIREFVIFKAGSWFWLGFELRPQRYISAIVCYISASLRWSEVFC